MSDAEMVVSLTIAIAGELESPGWAGVGCGVGAGVGVATGFAGGRDVVRRLCPDAKENKITTTKNETAGLDKFISFDWSAGALTRNACAIKFPQNGSR